MQVACSLLLLPFFVPPLFLVVAAALAQQAQKIAQLRGVHLQDSQVVLAAARRTTDLLVLIVERTGVHAPLLCASQFCLALLRPSLSILSQSAANREG